MKYVQSSVRNISCIITKKRYTYIISIKEGCKAVSYTHLDVYKRQVLEKKPFSHAGIIRFKGQLMTYVPGEGPCYRCVFKNPPPKDAVPTCKQAGVIGAMGGVIGSLPVSYTHLECKVLQYQ